MMPAPRPRSRRDFGIAIICALTVEFEAVIQVLDHQWAQERRNFGVAEGDYNSYVLGSIGNHNVVVTVLAGSGQGYAAGAASSLRTSFPSLNLTFIVGVCGGVPIIRERSYELKSFHNERNVYLGDLIISDAVIQYDRGRQHTGTFERYKGSEQTVGTKLGGFLRKMQARQMRAKFREDMNSEIKRHMRESPYKYPGAENDVLYKSEYTHKHRDLGCDACNTNGLRCKDAQNTTCRNLGCERHARAVDGIRRMRHPQDTFNTAKAQYKGPDILIGRVACGEKVIMSGSHRDDLSAHLEAIAFEMEGAAIWRQFYDSLIVKGVADYADSHKNTAWQPYASLVAASGVKVMLQDWQPLRSAVKNDLPGDHQDKMLGDALTDRDRGQARQTLAESLQYDQMEARSEQLNMVHVPPGSLDWIWTTDFRGWLEGEFEGCFWITGKPGSGKSTLMKTLPRTKMMQKLAKQDSKDYIVLEFFFDFRAGDEAANNEVGLVKMLISQLCLKSSHFNSEFERRHGHLSFSDMTIWQLMDVLCEVVPTKEILIYAFIDGIDEFCGDPQTLSRFLYQLQSRAGFKMCLASRPEAAFLIQDRAEFRLTMQDHNSSIIQAYISESVKMHQNKAFSGSGMFDDELRKEIVRRAEGVVVWARLAVDEIFRIAQTSAGLSRDKIISRLDDVPQDLQQLYDRSLSQVQEAVRSEAAALLFFLYEFGGALDDRVLHGLCFFHKEAFPWLCSEECQRLPVFVSRVETVLGSLVDIVSLKKNGIYSTPWDWAYGWARQQILRPWEPEPSSREIRLLHETFSAHLRNSDFICSNIPDILRQTYGKMTFKADVFASVIQRARDALGDAPFPAHEPKARELVVRFHMQSENSFGGHFERMEQLISRRLNGLYQFLAHDETWQICLPLLEKSITSFSTFAYKQDQWSSEHSSRLWKDAMLSLLFFRGLAHHSGRMTGYNTSEPELLSDFGELTHLWLASRLHLSSHVKMISLLPESSSWTPELLDNLICNNVEYVVENSTVDPFTDHGIVGSRETAKAKKLEILETLFNQHPGVSRGFDLFFRLIFLPWVLEGPRREILREDAGDLFCKCNMAPFLNLVRQSHPVTSARCSCGLNHHPLITWIVAYIHVEAITAKAEELNDVYSKFAKDKLDILVPANKLDEQLVSLKCYCSFHGSPFHFLVKQLLEKMQFRPFGLRESKPYLQAFIVLATLGKDPMIEHQGTTPLDLLEESTMECNGNGSPSAANLLIVMKNILSQYRNDESWPGFDPIIAEWNLVDPRQGLRIDRRVIQVQYTTTKPDDSESADES